MLECVLENYVREVIVRYRFTNKSIDFGLCWIIVKYFDQLKDRDFLFEWLDEKFKDQEKFYLMDDSLIEDRAWYIWPVRDVHSRIEFLKNEIENERIKKTIY